MPIQKLFVTSILIWIQTFAPMSFATLVNESSEIGTMSAPQKLEYYIQKAQKAYFTGEDQSLAKAYYQEVAELNNKEKWSPDQIKAIHFAMLRTGQLSLTPEERDRWILESLNFAPELNPDSEIFPPPIIERFTALKKSSHLLTRKQSPQFQPAAPVIKAEDLRVQPNVNSQDNFRPQIASPLNVEKPFWKNKWVWAGVGVLVAGYIIYENNNQPKSESQSSTVTHGF